MNPEASSEDGVAEFGLVGNSPQIQTVLRTIKKLRNDASPVLIIGESGVGKELVARALHQVSPVADNVFLPVDSATLVGTLMESELFGHVKGAFTGAIDSKPGLVRAAEGGTLFLDEIGELTTEVQAKLLRLLQESEVRPIGATKPIKVNVRMLAATNCDLATAIEEGSFRTDLYYRLKVMTIRVPPLRERKADILPLARHFIAKHAVHSVSLSEAVERRFVEYGWPGNIRELENAIRHMVVMKSNAIIETHDLPSNLCRPAAPANGVSGEMEILPLEEIERLHIFKALEHTKHDIHTAALLLGIGKTTLYRKLKKYRAERTDGPQRRLFF